MWPQGSPVFFGCKNTICNIYVCVCVCVCVCVQVSVCSVVSLCDPHRLQPTRPLCPWDSPGKNTGVGCHFLPQGIFPTQVSCTASRFFFYRLSHQGSPKYICMLICICVFSLKAHLTCKQRLLSHCEKVSKHPWSQFLHSCSQE